MLPMYSMFRDTYRYEVRAREADRQWRFLADEGLLGLAQPAARAIRCRPHPLRRLLHALTVAFARRHARSSGEGRAG
jgi:hypothetical protein